MKDLAKVSVRNLSINVFYDVKSRSSFSWKYFGHLIITGKGNKRKILRPDQVYCLACLIAVKNESEDITFGSVKIKSYSKTVSTGNLSRHLRDEHQIRPDKSGPDLLTKHDKWLLARDLALWFCRSLLPLDSVSDEGMIDFFKKYNMILNDSDLPSRSSVSGPALSDVYESMLIKVKKIISSHAAKHFALTFDLWTDKFRRLDYITFTLHYLTSDFNVMKFTLSSEMIMGEKTGEKINERIIDIKKRFDLDGKNIVAVTDAEENMKRAVSLANMAHHLCLGHAFHNLVTEDGLKSIPEVAEVVRKCKKVVMEIRYHAPELQVEAKKTQLEFLGSLDTIAEMLDEDPFASIQDDDTKTKVKEEVEDEISPSESNFDSKRIPTIDSSTPTRWHSVLEMLESVYKCNREPINNMLRKIGQEEYIITQNEWMLLDDLVKFFKSFCEAVRILSSQNTCTINLALVFRSEIIDVLNSLQDDESLIILQLKRNMLTNIDKRFPVTKEIVAAALLDNRFMTLKEIDIYLESQNMTRTNFLSSCIREVIESDYIGNTNVDTASTSTSNNVETSLLHKLAKKHSTASQGNCDDQIKQECWRYIAATDPKEPKDGDLFSYWNSKKNAFPNIAALAKAILCVPATSTPSERVFSDAGFIITAKRSRLSPIRVNKMIFIHDNNKICKTDEKTIK